MYSHLEDYIVNLYKVLNIHKPYQIDMFSIAAQLGIEINYHNVVFRLGNEVILKNNSPPQQWMDFGHELAHVLIHSGSQLNMYPLYRDYQEWRAELFALHFCVPTFMLEQLKEVSVYDVMSLFNVDYDFAQKRLEMFQRKEYLYGKFSRA